MYVYVFSNYYWGDKVALRQDAASLGAKAGDLLKTETWYVFCLGETCAFQEKVKYTYAVQGTAEILYKQLLSPQTLGILHRFVHHWYTTYHKSLPLWLENEDAIGSFLKGAPKKIPKPSKAAKAADIPAEVSQFSRNTEHWKLEVVKMPGKGQQLVVIPDLRTLWAILPQDILHGTGTMQDLAQDIAILHGQSTDKQKRDAFWALKAGKKDLLVCTPSQIFQDRYDLESIILVDQHKRRYKNQQDPRYDAVTVVKYRAEKLWASLTMTWSELWTQLTEQK